MPPEIGTHPVSAACFHYHHARSGATTISGRRVRRMAPAPAPDMTPGGEWHSAHVARLRWAASFYDNSEGLVTEGLAQLAIHHLNCDEYGPAPKGLQLSWWEFPESSWDDVWLSGSMNLLTEPKHQILPNSPMNDEELKVAKEFVDELVALGVLRPPTDAKGQPVDIFTNAPLFTVPKPGQPGQYHCIADC